MRPELRVQRPQPQKVKARGIELHGQPARCAGAGQAANFEGFSGSRL